MKIPSFFLLFFSAACSITGAQTPAPQTPAAPFVLGVVDKIESAQLSETRTLNIYLPDSYSKNAAEKYPVIYLLDGSADEDFIHITGLVQFLTMIGAMPNSIVVGIGNVDRKRDFTFPTRNGEDLKKYPTTGHSDKFIAFIEKELQPYIEKNYRVSTERTIIGQSLGGLLATEILLKKPELFDNYVIVSPSLWWDAESLLSKAPELLKNTTSRPLKVYVSVGTEGKQMEDDAAALVQDLKAAGDKNMKIGFVPLPEEDHLTILHNSAYKALMLLNKK